MINRRMALSGILATASPAIAMPASKASAPPQRIVNEREALHQYRTWLLREATAVAEELERGGELRVSARGMSTSCPAFWFHSDAKTSPLDRAQTVMTTVGCQFSRSVTG